MQCIKLLIPPKDSSIVLVGGSLNLVLDMAFLPLEPTCNDDLKVSLQGGHVEMDDRWLLFVIIEIAGLKGTVTKVFQEYGPDVPESLLVVLH